MGQGLKVRKGQEKELHSGFELLCRAKEKQQMHFFLRIQTSIMDTDESIQIPQCCIYEAIQRHDTGQFLKIFPCVVKDSNYRAIFRL